MTEQQPFDVLQRFPGFELRRYPSHLVAEVEVTSTFTDAGNDAFRVPWPSYRAATPREARWP